MEWRERDSTAPEGKRQREARQCKDLETDEIGARLRHASLRLFCDALGKRIKSDCRATSNKHKIDFDN